jgi:hypothetical protein
LKASPKGQGFFPFPEGDIKKALLNSFKKVYEQTPFTCFKWQGEIHIISLIDQPE